MDIYLQWIQLGKIIKFQTENEYNINRLNKLLNKLKIDYKIKMMGKNYLIEFKSKDVSLENIDLTRTRDSKSSCKRSFFRKWFYYRARYKISLRTKIERRKAEEKKLSKQLTHLK